MLESLGYLVSLPDQVGEKWGRKSGCEGDWSLGDSLVVSFDHQVGNKLEGGKSQ